MNARRKYEYNTDAVKWLIAIADAINDLGPAPEGFDIGDIHLEFDGCFTGLGIGGSEFGEQYVVMATEEVKS